MNKGSSATTQESVRQAKKRLERLVRQCKEVPLKILESEAPRIRDEAKWETPFKTGKLEDSVKVKVRRSTTHPGLNISASARSIRGYNYAGIQHENTTYNHPIKGNAHYLSGPFYRGVDRIERSLRREIRY